MNKTDPLFQTIEAECKQVARAAARRFGSLAYDDAVQEAWKVCLEAAPRLTPGRPPGPYFGRALALALPRYARQQANAVKFPVGREYEHLIPSVTPVGVRHPDDGGIDIRSLASTDDFLPVREALQVVKELLEPARLAPVARVILDGECIDAQAAASGMPAHQLRTMVNCARVRILRDPRILEIAERSPNSESMRLILHHAGVQA